MARQPAKKRQAPPAKRNERTKGDIVTPDYTFRLMEHLGPTEAARKIGVTPGTLFKARQVNVISRPFEVAARGVWHEEGYAEMERSRAASAGPRTTNLGEAVTAPISEGITLMLVQVPKQNAAMLMKTADMLGATVVVQD